MSDQRIVVMDARQAAGEHGDEFQELIDQYDKAPTRAQLIERIARFDHKRYGLGRFAESEREQSYWVGEATALVDALWPDPTR